MRRYRNAAMTMWALAALAQVASAAPPKIEVRTPFGGGLTPGCWQPLDVVLTQPADAERVEGSVHLSLYDPRSQADLGTTLRPVALPAQPGAQTVRFTVFVPEKTAPVATVQVRSGTRDRESLVAERRFEGIPLHPNRLPALIVTNTVTREKPESLLIPPDALPENATAYDAIPYVEKDFDPASLTAAQREALQIVKEEKLFAPAGASLTGYSRVTEWTRAAATPNTEWEGGATLFTPLQKGEGLTPPPFAQVALAVGLYLLCVIPLQYALLKRFDRREWAWFTTPALVLLFTVGIYAVGSRGKSRTAYHNVAAVAEMGEGSGYAQVLAGVGIYSPRRTRYDIRAGRPDALFFSPSTPQAGRREYGSVLTEQGEDARAVDVRIPQWAMRLVGVRTHARLGKGVAMDLKPQGDSISGTVRNDTGFPIANAQINRVPIGTLAPGQTVSVTIPLHEGNVFVGSRPDALWPDDPIASKIATQVQSELYAGPRAGDTGPDLSSDLILRGWIHGSPVPITVRDTESGAASRPAAQATLLIVHGGVK